MKKYKNLNLMNFIASIKSNSVILSLFLVFSSFSLLAQSDDPGPTDKPVKNTFNSAWLIDNQSVMVPIKGTFEFDILHRFGTMGNGYQDLWGLYSPSNIRFGFSYAPINNLSVGFGLTKFKNYLDLNAKYALLKQTTSGRMPISLTYFGNIGIDTRNEDNRDEIFNPSDRYSYFHQLIVARKFGSWLSLQVAGSVSHFNIVVRDMQNDHYAISGGAKVKITELISGIVNIDQAITKHDRNNPNPNLSFGIEMSTSSHAFQIFIGNYSNIIPQENNFFNSNNYLRDEGESFGDNFLLGFNITRLWNF